MLLRRAIEGKESTQIRGSSGNQSYHVAKYIQSSQVAEKTDLKLVSNTLNRLY